MKKLAFVLGSLLSMFVAPSFAQQCGEPRGYQVQTLNFENLSLSEALSKVTAGTLFVTHVPRSELLVTARSLAGPLNAVLDKLGQSSGFTWSRDDCAIKISLRGEGSGSWEIRASDALLSSALIRWGKQAGYQVIWDEPKDFPVTATATFTGSFEDAIKAVVDALKGSDTPFKAVFYSNKVVRFVRFDGQTTDLKR